MDCWDRFFFDYPEMEPPGEQKQSDALWNAQN